MNRRAKEAAFWVAVALAGALGVWMLKILGARLPLPDGAKEAIAAL